MIISGDSDCSDSRLVDLSEWLRFLTSDETKFDFIHANLMDQTDGWRGADGVMRGHLLYFVESGAVDGVIDDRRVRLDAGGMAWIPVGNRRHFRNAESVRSVRTRRVLFNLRVDGVPLTFIDHSIAKSEAWDLAPYLRLINDAWRRDDAGSELELRSLIACVSIRFMNLRNRGSRTERVLDDNRKNKLLAFVISNIHRRIDPAELAALVGLSPDYFSRVFRATFGIPPKSFLVRERLRQAAAFLIETNLTIKEICWKVGEDDMGKFHHQFKKTFGAPPGAYRRNAGR